MAGRYRLMALLGAGAAGAVFRAHDAQRAVEVAVKVLLDRSERAVARLAREVDLARALDHPGVVRILDHGLHDGTPFVVLDLVQGARPLDAVARGASRRARVRWILELAEALGHAHARGVVHRDVKPGNVLIDDAGRVRLVDFGVARVEGAERLTHTGELVGTLTTMAPEQLAGDSGAVGPATDVWALGVLLYELLTDAPPFAASHPAELFVRVRQESPRQPRTLDPTIAPALENLCLRALEKRPERRPPDGGVFARELRAALAARAPRRSRALRVAALAGAAGVALATLAVLARRPEERPGPTAPAAHTPPTSSAQAAPLADSLALARAAFERGKPRQALHALGDAPPAAGEALALRVRLLAALGDAPATLALLDQVELEGRPDEQPLRAQRALLLLALDRDEEARDVIESLADESGTALALSARFQAAARSGDDAEAGRALSALRAARVEDPWEVWFAAEALAVAGEHEAALRRLEDLDATQPGWPWGLARQALELVSVGRAAEGEATATRAIEASDGELPLAFLARARARLALGQSSAACEDAARARRLAALADERTALTLAEALDAAGRTADALRVFEELSSARPLPRTALAARGRLRAPDDALGAVLDLTEALEAREPGRFSGAGRAQELLRRLREGPCRRDHARAAADPRTARAYEVLQRDGAAGLAAYEDLVRDYPACAALHVNRAAARRRVGDGAGQLADLRAAVALAPGLDEAWDLLAQALTAAGDADGARAALARGLAHNPRSALLHFARALDHQTAHHFDAAVAGYEAALRLDPRHTSARFNLAMIQANIRGDPAGALPVLQALWAEAPEDLKLSLNLGRVLLSLGRAGEARPHLERVAAGDDPLLARDAREALGWRR